MPTMRRSTRAAAAKAATKAQQQQVAVEDSEEVHQQSTLAAKSNSNLRGKRRADSRVHGYSDATAAAAAGQPNGAASNGNGNNANGGGAAVDWSTSSSPLSSISTPVTTSRPRRQRTKTGARRGNAANNNDEDDDGDEVEGDDGDDDDDARSADETSGKDAVNELLTKAADAIRSEVERDQLTADDDDGEAEGTEASEGEDGDDEGLTRSRASSAKRRRSADSASSSVRATATTATPRKRRAARSSAPGDGEPTGLASDGAEDSTASANNTPSKSKTKGTWRPGKRGRPPKHILEQRRLARAALEAEEGGGGNSTYMSANNSSTSTRLRTRRQSGAPRGAHQSSQETSHNLTPSPGSLGHSRGPGVSSAVDITAAIAAAEESTDDEEDEKDEDGERKIDRNGCLLGGREFICPVFLSPYRKNKQRQYVLTMDCCRFTGARDSYMLFKQHPHMRRVETTQEERDLLAESRMIPKVTRFRPIAMITARTAFREFGSRIVKNGRYVIDDYWESRKRREAKHPEGTMVADMDVYRSVMAAHAAGVTPGSTRKARKSSSAHHRAHNDTSTHASNSRGGTPTLPPGYRSRNSSMMLGDAQSRMGLGGPAGSNGAGGGMMVSSWVQLEAQQRLQRQMAAMQPAQFRPGGASGGGGLTMANALQQQLQIQQQQMGMGGLPQQTPQQLQQQQQLMLSQQAGVGGEFASEMADGSASAAGASVALCKPMFRKARAAETAEVAFESSISVHRSLFSDDRGFVDGTPLLQSMAVSWPKATSLSNKLKQRKGHQQQQQRTDTEGTSTPVDYGDQTEKGLAEDLFGPMAYASGKMTREFNSSARLWREDNGGTWVDPHTGVRQVPENLQPTAVRVERLDVGDKRWRRTGKSVVEPLVSFVEDEDVSQANGDNGEDDSGDYPLALLPGQYQRLFPIHQTRFGQTYQQAVSSYHYHWARQLAILKQQQQQQQQHTASKKR